MRLFFNKSKQKKKAIIFIGLVVLVAFIFILLPANQKVFAQEETTTQKEFTETGGIANKFTGFIGPIIGGIASVIVAIEGWAIKVLTKILMAVVKYNDFITAEAVKIGWTLVRDIANLFFVVILLGIAIATILRVESYNFKRLLPKLLIMAVLVNFSKTIAGLIIDFAQVVMMTFVAAFASTTAGNLIQTLQIQKIIAYDTTLRTKEGIDLFDLVVTASLMVIMLLITIIVIMVILAVLVIRIVMLWLLVVLSPLAYILAAFPQGQRYAQQWWQEFSKYVIIGPILAFFLWLTFAIASSGNIGQSVATDDINVELGGPAGMTGETETNVISRISDSKTMLSFIIGIALLMGSLVITQQMGVAGGSMAGQMFGRIRETGLKPLKKTLSGAKKVSQAPFQFVARKVNEGIYEDKLPSWVNPAAMYRGWVARRTDLHERAKLGATAGTEELWEKKFTGVAQPRRLKLQFAEQGTYANDYKFLPKEKLGELAAELLRQPETSENLAKRRAVVQTAYEQGYDDDLLAHPDIIERYGEEYTDPATGRKGKKILHKEMYSEFFGDFIGQHEAGFQVLNNGDNISHRTKHFAIAGLAVYDDRLGKSRMANVTGQRQLVGKDRDKKDVYAEAYEAQKVHQVEYNKEPGRAKLQTHFQGEIPVVKWDDKTIPTSAARFTKFNLEQITSKISGQEPRGLKEHTIERTVNLEIGGGTAFVDHKSEGLDVTGEALQNVADIDKLHDKVVQAWWDKTGGKTAEPTFIVNGESFTLNDIRSQRDQILAAKTSADWQALNVPAGGGPAPMAAFEPGTVKEGKIIKGGVLGSRTASTTEAGQQAGLGIDFADEGLEDLTLDSNWIGANLKGEAKNRAIPNIMKYYQKYLDSLDDTQRAAAVNADELRESLEKAGNIRLTNIAHPQWEGKALSIARHEKAHSETESWSSQEKQDVLATADQGKLKESRQQYKKRWGDTMTDQEIDDEILADLVGGHRVKRKKDGKRGETKLPASQAATDATEEKIKEVRSFRSKEVVRQAQSDIDKSGEELQKAVKTGFNTEEIVGALMGIENTLNALKSSLEKMPAGQVNKGELSKLAESISQIKGHRANQGSALDPSSANGILKSINNNLINIYKRSGKKIGRGPKKMSSTDNKNNKND